MRYNEKAILRDGSECIIRNATQDDAGEILKHMKITSGETNNMLRYPDEITMSEADERTYIKYIETSENAILICAEIAGRIVACGGINPVARAQKCLHRAEFGISIQREQWGRGIGSLIISAAISSARQAGYRQLELDVVSDNARAIALYKKFGFETYGLNKKAFLLRSGEYQELYLMARNLGD